MSRFKAFSVKNRNILINFVHSDMHFVVLSFCQPYDYSVGILVTMFVIKTELISESCYIFCFHSVLPYENRFILKKELRAAYL